MPATAHAMAPAPEGLGSGSLFELGRLQALLGEVLIFSGESISNRFIYGPAFVAG